MIDYSTAASIAVIAIPLSAVIITTIKVRGMAPTARIGTPYGGDPPSPKSIQCSDHSGLITELAALKEGQDRIECRMDKNFEDLFNKMDANTKGFSMLKGSVDTFHATHVAVKK